VLLEEGDDERGCLIVDLGVDQKDLWVVISMMVLCNAIDEVEYDRARSGLSNTPLDVQYDINSIEK
tara:strand:- start:247 stop:444 length:198 start_codon:yes stop_codon:yes gene_type:complete